MKRTISVVIALVLLLAVLLPTGASASENPVPKAKQAVVLVYSGIYYSQGRMETYDYWGSYSRGTAFGVYAEGSGAVVFATNAHVVCDDYSKPYEHVYICVDGADVYDRSTVVECDILYVDTQIDVAIIRAEAPIGGVGTLPLRRSEELETGDQVFALGYPGISDEVADENNYTAEDITVTDGIISRYMTVGGVKSMAHTATVNHGNSGGPLIDQYGNAIGINSFIYTDKSTSDLRSYAIYIDYVVDGMDHLGIPYTLVSGEAPAAEEPAPTQETPAPSRETEPTTTPEETTGNTVPGSSHEEESERNSTGMILILVGGLAALVLIIVLVILLAKKKPAAAPAAQAPAARTSVVPPVQGPAVTVFCVSGPLRGQAWRLDTVLTIGRDSGNTIGFPADTKGISRQHCRIERRGTQIVVMDLGSSFGTFIGGRKLMPNVPVPVGPNTEIWLASDKIRFLIR